MAPARFPAGLALSGRGPWRLYRGSLLSCHPLAWSSFAATPGRKRKGSARESSDERLAKRGRRNQQGPSKRKAAIGDGPEENEAKRRRAEALALPDVPRPIIWGSRSRKDGLPWTCDSCMLVNDPSRRLFVDLPAFKCRHCDAPGRACFKFSYANLSCNCVCPIGKIKNQKNTDFCAPFALTMGAEITIRIRSVLSGASQGRKGKLPELCPFSLIKASVFSMPAGAVPDFYSLTENIRLAESATRVGIHDMRYRHVYKVGGVERVDLDFPTICQALADGYPLVTEIFAYPKFDDLSYGKIYKSQYNFETLPEETLPEGSMVEGHFVVLVGASRSATHDLYYFVNSYGKTFCIRINRKTGATSGGVGKVRAADIALKPFKFFRLSKVEEFEGVEMDA